MSRRNKKGRSSIITIFLVLLVIALAAFITIKVLSKEIEEEDTNKEYISHLDEEDFMIYEYDNIYSSLNGLYAFAIKDDYIVGLCLENNLVDLYKIDAQKEYDYSYFKGNLYLLDKELGQISVISLKDIGNIVDTISLNERVESFQVVDDGIYYIANNILKKIENSNIVELYSNITCNKFVVKNDEIFIVKDKKLLNIKDKEEKTVAEDVENIEYYSYYERDRLIYDTSNDGENIFKNIYNYYNGQSISSIKNNTYFIPYDEFKYVYVTNDRKNIVRINDSGSNEYIYKVEDEDKIIDNIVFYKGGNIEFKVGDKIMTLDLNSKTTSITDNITCLNNIKFIK